MGAEGVHKSLNSNDLRPNRPRKIFALATMTLFPPTYRLRLANHKVPATAGRSAF